MKMKKLTLMVTAAVFAASPVSAMEKDNEFILPAKKRFAVVTNDDLKVNLNLNVHADVDGNQTDFLRAKNVFAFSIRNDKEKNGVFAFPVAWDNVQSFDPISNGEIYPWSVVRDYLDVQRYRVTEYFEGVVCVDTTKSPCFTKDDNVYYSAKIYKALPRHKTLWFRDSNESTVATWDLFKRNQKDFSFGAYITGEIRRATEPQDYDFRTYSRDLSNRHNQLNRWVREALEDK